MDEVEVTSEILEQAGLKNSTVKRARPEAINWIVVLYNNYLPDKVTIDPNAVPLAQKEAWFNRPDQFKYAVFGREKCPKTGKPHLQGFVQLHKKKLLTGMKKLFPDGQAHFEIAGGNPQQNRTYCIKVNFNLIR